MAKKHNESGIDFRWVAGIAIWTMLSGPIFTTPASYSPPVKKQAETPTSKPLEHPEDRNAQR